MKRYEQFMRLALELAERGRGWTSPNPVVGAVVTAGGEIVGEGWHERVGGPHAEVVALTAAGVRARGADLYVTLEPCAHHGRTPPCTGAILAAGVRRVIVPVTDPNPRVDGRGLALLREKGVEVITGVLEQEARRRIEAYRKHVVTGIPFVTLKMAVSLDGKIATRTGDARWITGPASRERVHRMRAAADAVLVGVGTVLADDPALNARPPGGDVHQPLRVVIDSRLRTPTAGRLFRETGGRVVIATTEAAPDDRAAALEALGADVLRVPGDGPRVDPARLLRELGSRGVTSLLVEGGAGVFTAFVEAGLADKVVAFVAPVIIGGSTAPTPVGGLGAATMADCLRLTGTLVETEGDDAVIQGYLRGKG
jgi:diaminohydroxyphosphoribosylaminopyrimidine deaminase/5-amino-6-(5-phosphoribosylamino)uracil reductase